MQSGTTFHYFLEVAVIVVVKWVHYFILYSIVKESTFLKGNYGIYKRFIDVFYILTSA